MIESPLLDKFQGYIAGHWVGADDGGTLPVVNPATGEPLANVPKMGAAETIRAVEAADSTLSNPPSAETRRGWLNGLGDMLLENKVELGRIITLEHGKPLAEGIGEVEYAATFFHYFAGQLHHLADEPLPGEVRGCRWTIAHRPAGVAGLIVPWNFPMGMVAKKLAAAMGAGCPVVMKPAGATPLSAVVLCVLAERLGVDPGRVNLVIGQSGPIGNVLCSHPAVGVISFTGSTEVGRLLIAQTAPHIKKLALELGGNAPFIGVDDADLEVASDELIGNKFRSGGQTCVCTNRVLVHENVTDRFLDVLAPKVEALKVGNGMDADVKIGPLVNRDGFDKVAEHVADAIAKGAVRVVGNDPPRPDGDWGAFYPPTLLRGVTCDMRVCREETFGPVIAVATFTDDDEVVAAANDTEYGLAAYVFSGDVERGESVAARLRSGHVGLNTGCGPAAHAPFGGMKQSGIGREGGVDGLLEFCETQVIAAG